MISSVPFPYQKKKHQKGIPSLYALKAICAFFVVAIHCGNWGKEYLMPIFTVAVPCFFAISGYFLYTGDSEKEIQHAWKWFRKIILITLSTNLFYYLFNSGLGYSYAPRELLINIITGSQISAPLWYLTSFWEALLTFILIRKVCPKLLVVIPFCFIIHLITMRYSFLLFEEMPKGPIRMGTNFITIALPFICIGYFLAKNKDKLLKLQGIFLYPLIFAIAIWIEYSFFLGTQIRMAAYLIVTPFFAISLLLFCLKYPNFFTDFLAWTGKEHSANIYYFHLAVCDLFVRVAWHLGMIIQSWSAYPTLLTTFALSLLLGFLKQYIHPHLKSQKA